MPFAAENRAPDEHDEIGWFRPDEAADLDLVDVFLADLIFAAAAPPPMGTRH